MKLMDLIDRDDLRLKTFVVEDNLQKNEDLTKVYRDLDRRRLIDLTDKELDTLKDFYLVDTDEDRKECMLENIQNEKIDRKGEIAC